MWIALLLFNLNAESASVCREGERPLFFCGTQGQFHALCASNELTPEKGYIQYRSRGLQYPTDPELPVRIFEFWMDARGTGVTFGVRGTTVELLSGSEDLVTIGNRGRFTCPRAESEISLSAPAVQSFLRSAGLLR